MKIRMFCRIDYANMMYGVCQALKQAGQDCEAYIHQSQPFGYTNQATYADYNQMKAIAQEADVIHIFHSDNEIMPFIKGNWRGKRLNIWHTGTPYRQNVEFHNSFWRGYKVYTDQPEFIAGGLNAEYIAAGVDFSALESISAPVSHKFAHYPSSSTVKGTTEIQEISNSCGVKVHIDTSKATHDENLKRIAACEVYVELFAPYQNGKPYGQWGVTAMEAAAMKRCVITNEVTEVYKKFYGTSFVYAANNRHHFASILHAFNNMDKEELQERQYDSYMIAKTNHSYKAVAERMLNGL